jgi:glycosyltransferase involved in cell wall biosynthesis
MKITISVIIPAYNTKQEKLQRAIESVLSQTFSNIELIIVDDGSVVPFSGLEQKITDQRIIWKKNLLNKGVSYSRNIAINMANGLYIAFLDSDDWWELDKLERQFFLLEKSNSAWCYTLAIRHNFEKIDYVKYCIEGNVYKELLAKQLIVGSCSSVMIKKDVFDEIGGFSCDKIIEDWDMWIRISNKYEVKCVKEYLVHLDLEGSERRSKNIDGWVNRVCNLIEKYKNEMEQYGIYQKVMARFKQRLGKKYIDSGEFKKGMMEWFGVLKYEVWKFPIRSFTKSLLHKIIGYGK